MTAWATIRRAGIGAALPLFLIFALPAFVQGQTSQPSQTNPTSQPQSSGEPPQKPPRKPATGKPHSPPTATFSSPNATQPKSARN